MKYQKIKRMEARKLMPFNQDRIAYFLEGLSPAGQSVVLLSCVIFILAVTFLAGFLTGRDKK